MRKLILPALVCCLVAASDADACGRHRHRGLFRHRRAYVTCASVSSWEQPAMIGAGGCASCGISAPAAWGTPPPSVSPYAAPYQGGQRERIQSPPRSER